MLAAVRELAEMLPRRREIRGVRSLGRQVRAEIDRAAGHHDRGAETSARGRINPFGQIARSTRETRPVPHIPGRVSLAQVRQPVIGAITIGVIDESCRPAIIQVQPHETMCFIIEAVEKQPDIAECIARSGDRPDPVSGLSLVTVYEPTELAGAGVVGDDFAQPYRRQRVSWYGAKSRNGRRWWSNGSSGRRELAAQLAICRDVGGMRSVGGVKDTDVAPLAIMSDDGSPTTPPVPFFHAAKTPLVRRDSAGVGCVLLRRRLTKIGKSIVGWVAVPVVDQSGRPRAVGVKPCEVMFAIKPPVDHNSTMPMRLHYGTSPRPVPLRIASYPPEPTRLRIIAEKVSQPSHRNHIRHTAIVSLFYTNGQVQ